MVDAADFYTHSSSCHLSENWNCVKVRVCVLCAEHCGTSFIAGGVNVGGVLLRVEFTPKVMNGVRQRSAQYAEKIYSQPFLKFCWIAAARQDSVAHFNLFPDRRQKPLELPRRFIEAAVKNFIPPLAGWLIPPLMGYYCKIGCATFLMRESAFCQQPVN